jgi:hypothetical protein
VTVAAQLEIRGFGESSRVLRVQSAAIRDVRRTFRPVPENLRQMAGQARATNDPSMLDEVATQLETQGFREQAQPLRAQAAALRQRSQARLTVRAAEPVGNRPQPVVGRAASAQPTALSPALQKMVADAIQNGTWALVRRC